LNLLQCTKRLSSCIMVDAFREGGTPA
jgi:hypothetical protein